MKHLHYDRASAEPLHLQMRIAPRNSDPRVFSMATGHTYIMQHLPYRLGRIFTPSHFQCHQLRRVRAVTQRLGPTPARRAQPELSALGPVVPRPVLCAFLPLRGTPFDTVGTFQTLSTALRVTTFAAFSGDCNKVMHALNGNYIWYYSFCPRSHSKEWRDSFFLPNGMRVFRYSFYSKDSLWLHAHRRGSTFEIETTRRESPTLYGITRRAVASKGGEPGSRWQLLQRYREMPRLFHRASDDDTYRTTHLQYGGVQDTGCDDTYRISHLHYAGHEPRQPSGYQHRSAHGGCSQGRGQRSASARDRRFHRWVEGRREARRDFRLWNAIIRISSKPVNCLLSILSTTLGPSITHSLFLSPPLRIFVSCPGM